MEKFLKYKKYIIIFISFLFLVSIGIFYYFYNTKNNIFKEKEEIKVNVIKKEIPKEEDIESEIVEDIPVIKEYTVDVKGAINNPGVYKLTENNIVNDAINLAGGLNKYADTKCINLSKKIHDEMVIYVYTKNETWKILNPETQTKKENTSKDEAIICEEVKNDAYIKENKSEKIEVEETKKTGETKETVNTLININNDDIEKLTTLPGVGEAKAKTIIEYRETNGNFKTIEELKNVSGIGDSIFEKIKSLITI